MVIAKVLRRENRLLIEVLLFFFLNPNFFFCYVSLSSSFLFIYLFFLTPKVKLSLGFCGNNY